MSTALPSATGTFSSSSTRLSDDVTAREAESLLGATFVHSNKWISSECDNKGSYCFGNCDASGMRDKQWIETFQRLPGCDFEYFLEDNPQWAIRVRQKTHSPMAVYVLCWRAEYEVYFNFAFYRDRERMIFTLQGGADQEFQETIQRTVILSPRGYTDIDSQLPLCLAGFHTLIEDVISGADTSGDKIELSSVPKEVMDYLFAELRMWLMAFMYKLKVGSGC
jgi:hypothetical protein